MNITIMLASTLLLSLGSLVHATPSAELEFRSAQNSSDNIDVEKHATEIAKELENQKVEAKAKANWLFAMANNTQPRAKDLIVVAPSLEQLTPGQDFRVESNLAENGDEVRRVGPLFYETANREVCQIQLKETYSWGFILDTSEDQAAVRCYDKETSRPSKAFRVVRSQTGIRLLELSGWKPLKKNVKID